MLDGRDRTSATATPTVLDFRFAAILKEVAYGGDARRWRKNKQFNVTDTAVDVWGAKIFIREKLVATGTAGVLLRSGLLRQASQNS
jgi:hypothetical protein